MKKLTFILVLLITQCIIIEAQMITIQPYLQDVSPHEIYILWETDSNEESIVEWGETESLGNSTEGISYVSNGSLRIHETHLTNLNRFTQYFYRVKTGSAISEIYHFKTPPFASDQESFRVIAMSDMQKDNSKPNKFNEIVEQGVISYIHKGFGEDLAENISMILIPGDLVVNGNTFSQWKNDFFNPAEDLLKYVPVYPVLGNHENNAAYYFNYFKMPDNGTVGYEEHWWTKDYGNVRIIGLNSNGPYNNAEQLLWLDSMLINACETDSIDFVFAQLHHPHKSELWTPGESGFTGQVVQRLEQFTTNCGKPSIHFFGHTHGYSRGQSRDHKHLWINAATAGGAIDNWGEFPNFDYDEFSVSQDEYGFVIMEIINDEDPRFVLKRINRGDEVEIKENYISDSLVIRLNSSTVAKPDPIYPVDVDQIIPECVELKASGFSADDALALHGQSHWQVTTTQNGFDNPIAESWKNFENWYFEVNTQENDDLSDETIQGLVENTNYIWRVRYRDREMNWSAWSDEASFTTGESAGSNNLLTNPGAESDLQGWEIVEGVVEAVEAQVCDGINPYVGEKYFAVGGICEHSAVGRAIQNVDVSMYADSINAEVLFVNFGGFLSNFGGSDLPEIKINYLNSSDVQIGTSDAYSTLNNSWTWINGISKIPAETSTIQLELKGTRNAGTDNDSYFDALFLKLGLEDIDCSVYSSAQNYQIQVLPDIQIAPNPLNNTSVISLEGQSMEHVYLQMIDFNGKKVQVKYRRSGDSLEIEKGNLSPGNYIIWLRENNRLIGKGKLTII